LGWWNLESEDKQFLTLAELSGVVDLWGPEQDLLTLHA
jgi:hypothetical protein